MIPIEICAISTVNALGCGLATTTQGLMKNRSALRPCDFDDVDLKTYIGRIPEVENRPVDDRLSIFDCRNNRLAQMALQADDFSSEVLSAIERYGAERLAVVLGTSTSGIHEGELAFSRRSPETGKLPDDFHFAETQDHHSLATFVQTYFGIKGPAITVSTACSSSAKVFADATQLIETGVCEAAVVGGADSLCLLTLYGFNSLELLDTAPCRPNDAGRTGISIGEAAGFALLEKEGAAGDNPVALLLGYGESADAYHMSSPHPQGLGAEISMRAALKRAGLTPDRVDYINQHGTGTRRNDKAEDTAIARVFGEGMRCSSTKGATGHTLGAAGILEIAICCLAMKEGFFPPNVNLRAIDPEFLCRVDGTTARGSLKTTMSNSFGFGGSNCSIVLGAAE